MDLLGLDLGHVAAILVDAAAAEPVDVIGGLGLDVRDVASWPVQVLDQLRLGTQVGSASREARNPRNLRAERLAGRNLYEAATHPTRLDTRGRSTAQRETSGADMRPSCVPHRSIEMSRSCWFLRHTERHKQQFAPHWVIVLKTGGVRHQTRH